MVVSLSNTAVGFDIIHPHFKQTLMEDDRKVCCFFPLVSVFTRILCLHTGGRDGTGGKSVWNSC